MRKVKVFSFSIIQRRFFIDYLGVDISKRSSVVAHYKMENSKKSFSSKIIKWLQLFTQVFE